MKTTRHCIFLGRHDLVGLAEASVALRGVEAAQAGHRQLQRDGRVVLLAAHLARIRFAHLLRKRRVGNDACSLAAGWRRTLPNVVFGGSTRMAKARNSFPSALSASLTSILIEKKCDDSEIEPTVSASRTCRHMACQGRVDEQSCAGMGEQLLLLHTSFRSFVVSQPSVPPAPSESATHFFTPLRSNALSRCCDSNLCRGGELC